MFSSRFNGAERQKEKPFLFMPLSNQKCENCEQPLKPSQYTRTKREGERAVQENDNLVCRNYPACEKSEKETKTSK